MQDLFGTELSEGPLGDILSGYSSNKLLSKQRITKSERERYELEQLQKREAELKRMKSKKRKQMEEEEKDKYVMPKQKKMKHSHRRKHQHHAHRHHHDDNEADTTSANTDKADSENGNKLNDENSSNDQDEETKSPAITDDILKNLTEHQVISRLRQLQQPIRYFGETDEERLKRLRRLEILEHEREEGASKGLKNTSQSIKNEVERELEAAMAQTMGEMKKDGLNELEIDSKRQELKKKRYDEPRGRSSFNNAEDYVLFFFKRMLREWEQMLLQRSEDEKMSPKGKNATMLQKQARRDIRALFKQLKNRTVPADVLAKAEKMVFAGEKRNYVEAKRIFFEMAIGNAPWPMGVTMVGIHERSGRSKIFSSQIAHVMNDEVQRKYIHAMARLISFAQSKYPSLDPTRNMG
eukprot:CAMPEP_0197037652 /NCGR_PEP_ID=MMETSP1384-20130603/14798_1 /TAXON_ID=29189 /ORGANISM="Ammonia sp." /LENGTH=408 /DNA_ID=CAMNT_0042467981 /DNA_START=24 /DNA_END=1250 /DNA_ORIENTATION=-